MQRLPRRFRTTLAMLAVLSLAMVGGRMYLNSSRMAAQVAARLEALCGVHVTVGTVDVGLDSSVIRDMQLFEAASTVGLTVPWAVVSEAEADSDLLSLLDGNGTPRHLTLTGAIVTLRFDADGRLLTRLPIIPSSESPSQLLLKIDLRCGELHLCQEGRPDFMLENITASLRSEDGKLIVQATMADTVWGEWSAAGSVPVSLVGGKLDINTARSLHVTQPMLSSLPFVPLKTWEHVQAEGDTEANITLRCQADEPLHYRLTLTPREAKVHVTSINLDGSNASGQVIIEDKKVHLGGVSGRVADGSMGTEAELDFRRHPYQLHFIVKGHDLDVQELPRTWRLPPMLAGRLGGAVDLQIATLDGQTSVRADGQGEIQRARIAGILTRAIRMRVTNDGSGFRFQPVAREPKD